jgi:hypothetical protein
VQIGVVTLKEQRGAVASTLREWVVMMLAANARFAVSRHGGVALDDKPGGDLALDGLLEAVCANVAQTTMPQCAAHHGLTA